MVCYGISGVVKTVGWDTDPDLSELIIPRNHG